MSALPPVFHAQDYLPTLDISAYVATMNEEDGKDRIRAAERYAHLKRQAEDIASGFARMVSDIKREGILEDNLASIRRVAVEGVATQQASVDFWDRKASEVKASLRDLRRRNPKARILAGQHTALLEDAEFIRAFNQTALDAFREGLEALNAIVPQRLTAEQFAAMSGMRTLEEALPGLKGIQEELEAEVARVTSRIESDDEDRFNLRRALAILGGLLVGTLALHFSGVPGALIGAAAGSMIATRFAPLIESH
ncbi:MAG TPA: hypothetical protein VN851_03245 [Thermoanaerobaculia bacterium]|nr:hypothetical protein [Thermoanaerobaculia bacterium]